MKKVTSKLYKAVKGKDGKCVLAKKQRSKKPKKRAKKPKRAAPPEERKPEDRRRKSKNKLEKEPEKGIVPKKKNKYSDLLEMASLASEIFNLKQEKKEEEKPKKIKAILSLIEDKEEQLRAARNKRFSSPVRGGKLKKGKKPIPVRIVPEPEPELTELDILRNNKLALKQKLEEDKKARYNRNVALNSKDSQQGLVLGERGLLGPPSKKVPGVNGKGVEEDGMYDYQIEKIMKKFPAFKGVIAADEIDTIPADKKVAFVMNTSNRDEPGEHWVSVMIDTSPNVRSAMYYDPFGWRASSLTKKAIKRLIKRIDPETMILYKWNKVKQQDINTNTCGLHSMNFLMKMLKGKSFIEATGYSPDKPKDQSKKFEAEVEKKFSELM